jgi:hypothetical protein
MRVFAFAALGLSVALAACAPTADAPDGHVASNVRQCFNIPQVTSFRQGDPNQVFLRVGRSEIYELDTVACLDLDFATRLNLAPDSAGLVGSRLCTGDWARIVVPGSLSPNAACRVRVVRKLTDEQVAALPAAHVP